MYSSMSGGRDVNEGRYSSREELSSFALFFFFLGRVLPLVPRQILPRLLRWSPFPMVSPFLEKSIKNGVSDSLRRCFYQEEGKK
jgi:hypothetical protein